MPVQDPVFSTLTDLFPGFPYMACTDCREYTKRDSVVREQWAKKHAQCSQIRYLNEAPEEYEPCLEPLEALASVMSSWDS